jgi:nondiscriminating aspartyl-tRNA synthetase
MRTLIQSLASHIGEQVTIKWYVYTLRDKGKIAFLIVRDHTGLTQCVLESVDEIEKLHGTQLGTVISITWTVKDAAQTKYGVELGDCVVTVLNPVTTANDIDISKETINLELDGLLDHRMWTLRHPYWTQVFQVAAVAESTIRSFFEANGFTQINSPKLIGFPTEWGAEIFSMEYFGKTAYLAQSPQFYKQAMVAVFDRVYEIGRAYRAEKSNTSRHMSEILMLDMEMWFIDSFEDILQMTEQFITYTINTTWERAWDKLTKLGALRPLVPQSIPRITVTALHELMFAETGEDYRADLDVAPAEERFICEYAAKNRWSDLVFVTEFPWSDAKFYHHQNRANPTVADRADLLFRWVELATTTQREVNYEHLIQQIKDKGINPDQPGLEHYLDSFKYGMPEEGGFGFGIARFVQKLIGLSNVKEAELFPRDTTRLTP